MTAEQRQELERLVAMLPIGGDHWERVKKSVLVARMRGLLAGESTGECMGGAWSVREDDAASLIRAANECLKPVERHVSRIPRLSVREAQE